MRIGINIPKELHQRLQPLKGTMNISQICREALEARVEKYEEYIGWLDSDAAREVVAEICEKELERKALVEVDWEAIGYQDAKDWVQAATLADWDYWNRCRNDPHRKDTVWTFGRHVREGLMKGKFVSPGTARTFHQRHREYTDRVYKQDDEFWDWMNEEYDGLGPVFDSITAEQSYGLAWMTYTSAVWEKICGLREAYRLRWQREQVESRQDRPTPEAPDHIFEEIQRGG